MKNRDDQPSRPGSSCEGSDGSPRRSRGLPILGQVEAPVERRDAALNRVRILDATRKLLADRPIHAICMDEVARTAGVGKGTLYRRFADRASLCRALLNDDAIVLQDHVLGGLGLPANAPWMVQLEALLDALFDFVASHADLLAEAIAFERGDANRFDHPAHVWQRDTIALYLRQAIQAGEIPPLDDEVTAELILAGLDPDLLRYHLARGKNRAALRAAYRRFWHAGIHGPRCR